MRATVLPTPQVQAEEFERVRLQSVMEVGKTYYVISTKWYRLWSEYSKGNPPPPPIDNTPLLPKKLKTIPILREGLLEPYDYQLLSDSQWQLLAFWYGGGPSLPRKVILIGATEGFFETPSNQDSIDGDPPNTGTQSASPSDRPHQRPEALRVEVYLLKIPVSIADKRGKFTKKNKSFEIHISRLETVNALIREACRLSSLQISWIRLWVISESDEFRLLATPNLTLEEEALLPDDMVLIERRRSDGMWPRDIYQKSQVSKQKKKSGFLSGWPRSGKQENQSPGDQESSSLQRGVCGLYNLGNTCFMNSSIQCLSNTGTQVPLREFFLSGLFKKELNKTNVLGMKGAIAEAFASLLKTLWSGSAVAQSPKALKSVIQKFAPQFEGYSQHDSHEFLEYLLDGLHEDLNRIQKKQYVEEVDAAGRNDSVVAAEAWGNHLMRNNSVIVDLFHGAADKSLVTQSQISSGVRISNDIGQLKSSVTCPTCNHLSVTFEPFMQLPLPLRKNAELGYMICLFRHDALDAMPIQFGVMMARNATIKALRTQLALTAKIPSGDRVLLADIIHNRIYSFLDDDSPIESISANDQIVAYGFDSASFCPISVSLVLIRSYTLPPSSRSKIWFRMVQRRTASQLYSPDLELLGTPFLVVTNSGVTTNRQFHQMVYNACARMLRGHGMDLTESSSSLDDRSRSGVTSSSRTSTSSSSNQSDSTSSMSPSSESSSHSGNSNLTDSPQIRSQLDSADYVKSASEDEDETNIKKSLKGKIVPRESRSSKQPTSEPDWNNPPFRLYFTSSKGRGCVKSTCRDPNCTGHRIRIDDSVMDFKSLEKGSTIAIHWNSSVLKSVYDEKMSVAALMDKTAEDVRKQVEEGGGAVSLRDCLSYFTTVEQLGEQDAWYCPSCKTHVQGFKKFDIWKLPEILIIQLKRFRMTRYSREKLVMPVYFPLKGLSLSEFIHSPQDKEQTYSLYAVSNHTGSLGGGHYTAYAYHSDMNQWLHYNDARVTPVRINDFRNVTPFALYQLAAFTPAAYVLYYRRDSAAASPSSSSATTTTAQNLKSRSEDHLIPTPLVVIDSPDSSPSPTSASLPTLSPSSSNSHSRSASPSRKSNLKSSKSSSKSAENEGKKKRRNHSSRSKSSTTSTNSSNTCDESDHREQATDSDHGLKRVKNSGSKPGDSNIHLASSPKSHSSHRRHSKRTKESKTDTGSSKE